MMITIYGLPSTTKYQDLKVLIKQQCNIDDFILDNLVSLVNGTKKVRVGLADDSEGSHLIKRLDGYRFSGHLLSLVPVGKSSTSTLEVRGSYQQSDYTNQNINDRPNRALDEARPATWANNQWTSNQPQLSTQNSFSYQDSVAAPYGTAANTVINPHFELKDVTQQSVLPQHTQRYGYNNKSNLINLGPQRNNIPTICEIPAASSQASGRYPKHYYETTSDKPVTITKENFQGPSQYNLTPAQNQSSYYQSQVQISPWATQEQQKTFEKPVSSYDKKPYDDRKYSSHTKLVQNIKHDDAYKYDKSSREFSPQRKDYRDVDVGRLHPYKTSQYSDSRSPGRRVSPPNKIISSSGRPLPPGIPMSQSSRHVLSSSLYASSSGRHPSPSGRHDPQIGLQSPPPVQHSSQSGHYQLPSGQHGPQSARVQSPTGQHRIQSSRHRSPSSCHGLQSGRQLSPFVRLGPQSGRQPSLFGRHSPQTGRHRSPSGRQGPQSGRQPSPSSRHGPQSGRQPSPFGCHSPQSGRHPSPSGRHGPPGRYGSASGRSAPSTSDPHVSSFSYVSTDRHVSPPASGRQFPSKGREISPTGRQIPMERKISPRRDFTKLSRKDEFERGRKTSPPPHPSMDRRPKHQSAQAQRDVRGMHRHTRFSSPPRDQKQGQYQDDLRAGMKDVRPAYDTQPAPNETIYSGGYRANVRDEAVKYQPREHWKEMDKYVSKSIVDERTMSSSRLQKLDIPRASAEQESNRSRSPKRDRSPIRDRYKRHSPSPRSPRRSWALEKRRSPEIREPPPPPVWPQEREVYQQQIRGKISDRVIDKNSPVWETRETKREDYQNTNDHRTFQDRRPMEKDQTGKWNPISKANLTRFEVSKNVRMNFENRRDFTRSEEVRKLNPVLHGQEFRHEHSSDRCKPNYVKEEFPRKKYEYAGRIDEKKKAIFEKQGQLQKDIDEVYKRTEDFTKKAETYKKGEIKKEFNYDNRYGTEGRIHREEFQQNRDRENVCKELKSIPFNRDEERKTVHEDMKRYRYDTDDVQKLRSNQTLRAEMKAKRCKASEEIAEKIMNKYGKFLSSDIKNRVSDELKLALGHKLLDMFENNDVSVAEMVVKFSARHSAKDEENIFNEVMSSFPNHYRHLKRPAQDKYDIPAKSARRSPEENSDFQTNWNEANNWNIGLVQHNMPISANINTMSMMNAPTMVPMPVNYQQYMVPLMQEAQPVEKNIKDFVLYFFKDNFEPILEFESELLKDFLIQKLIKVTETSEGWAPDFTLNKKNSTCRHEVLTRDERSKSWILSLDFSEFKHFNVLVYDAEELWYERAAIWLPGHSRSKTIEPLTKLKLQNKNLEGVNIGKWKTVKKIVTVKGTRMYVDMPPSSARALEKYKMMLSFELQKVNVFLKAVAVDKDAFDAGLNENSLITVPTSSTSAMPSVGQHPDLVKMAFKGNKPFSLPLARKLKDIILYKLFKYHEQDGRSRTDFVKYGFCQGGFFGIVPENEESKRWLCSLDIGKIQGQPVIIIGADGMKMKYFKMSIVMPYDYNLSTALACERIRHSNQGVKGLNFNLWKSPNVVNDFKRNKIVLEVNMDSESVETLSKLNYQLDYIAKGTNFSNLTVESGYSATKLQEIIADCKAEMNDTYDVSNMDIDTESDNEVILLD